MTKRERKKIFLHFFKKIKKKNYLFEVHDGEFGIKFTFSKNILFYVQKILFWDFKNLVKYKNVVQGHDWKKNQFGGKIMHICEVEEETLQHLFIECPIAKIIWSILLSLLDSSK